MSYPEIELGKTVRLAWPFLRCVVDVHDGEGGSLTINSWRPGVDRYLAPNGGEGREVTFCNGTGVMILTPISRHKPGPKYPERVFYVRQWETPDGKVFGKTGLRITTVEAFRRRLRGYPYDIEEIDETEPPEPAQRPSPQDTKE
jgi:hypothetical protein